jgi:hypothetical protein
MYSYDSKNKFCLKFLLRLFIRTTLVGSFLLGLFSKHFDHLSFLYLLLRKMISRHVSKNAAIIGRSLAHAKRAPVGTAKADPKWSVFPREREGNQYDVNFSVLEDGVTPTGDCFRNARVELLKGKAGDKVSSPKLTGAFKLEESGDSMSHDAFGVLKESQDDILSNGRDLFVEDAGLGAASAGRVGARVYTQNAATALMFRKLMVPVPPRDVDHRARFDHWEDDERWRVAEPVWNSKTGAYDVLDRPQATKGERPIAAFIGGDHAKLAVQFVERGGSIVGSNIVAGEQVPLAGVVEGITTAATVLVNAQKSDRVALCSTSFEKAGVASAIVHASTAEAADAAAALAKKGMNVYGHYCNTFTADGVSAMWNGHIGASASGAADWSAAVPSVSVDGSVEQVHAVDPVNMMGPLSTLFFVEGAAKDLTAEEGFARIAALVDNEAKAEAIKAIFKNTKMVAVKSANDVK